MSQYRKMIQSRVCRSIADVRACHWAVSLRHAGYCAACQGCRASVDKLPKPLEWMGFWWPVIFEMHDQGPIRRVSERGDVVGQLVRASRCDVGSKKRIHQRRLTSLYPANHGYPHRRCKGGSAVASNSVAAGPARRRARSEPHQKHDPLDPGETSCHHGRRLRCGQLARQRAHPITEPGSSLSESSTCISRADPPGPARSAGQRPTQTRYDLGSVVRNCS